MADTVKRGTKRPAEQNDPPTAPPKSSAAITGWKKTLPWSGASGSTPARRSTAVGRQPDTCQARRRKSRSGCGCWRPPLTRTAGPLARGSRAGVARPSDPVAR